MSTKSENLLYCAFLAEQCNRYEDMIQFLEEMIKSREEDLSNEERNYLSIAYKKFVNSKRSTLRMINASAKKEKNMESSSLLSYILDYRKKIEDELTKDCLSIISMIDTELFKRASDDDARVFYKKMRGDHNRYICEYAEGSLKQKAVNDALEAYKEACEYAKSLPPTETTSKGLQLNFSLFYYEIMNDSETAIKIAEVAYEKAMKERKYEENEEESACGSTIEELLMENIKVYKGEISE